MRTITTMNKEFKTLLLFIAAFAACCVSAAWQSCALTARCWKPCTWSSGMPREHVLLCLVPAFFIAGAISVFVSQASVMKYLGARANKVLAYGVASVSGSVLAVCSCTVLPLVRRHL